MGNFSCNTVLFIIDLSIGSALCFFKYCKIRGPGFSCYHSAINNMDMEEVDKEERIRDIAIRLLKDNHIDLEELKVSAFTIIEPSL